MLLRVVAPSDVWRKNGANAAALNVRITPQWKPVSAAIGGYRVIIVHSTRVSVNQRRSVNLRTYRDPLDCQVLRNYFDFSRRQAILFQIHIVIVVFKRRSSVLHQVLRRSEVVLRDLRGRGTIADNGTIDHHPRGETLILWWFL